MASVVKMLKDDNVIRPPVCVYKQIQYECMMGSIAYGVSNDKSDIDVYGFCIPHKDIIFPHLNGYIQGFGKKPQNFEQFQQHHIKTSRYPDKEYDISIYSIIKFFQLVMDNNPNMIDALFVPRRCILYSSKIAEIMRENRRLFLHKGAWHKFKGYAYSQMHKMSSKSIREFIEFCDFENFQYDIDLDFAIEYLNTKGCDSSYISRFKNLYKQVYQAGSLTKRIDSISKYGYDVKFAYHVVRLLNEIEQILTEHDLDLERNREQLKAIRRGEWSIDQVKDYFAEKEKFLEQVYLDSTLQYRPQEGKIKELLLNCLEEHFGSLDSVISIGDKSDNILNDVENLLTKYRK